MKRLFVASFLAVVAAGCSEPPTAVLGEFSASILDGNTGGNEHFYWLPPLLPAPGTSGDFDGSLDAVVRICELAATGCAAPPIAEFTTSTGPGSETVRVVSDDEHYIVNWHTNEFDLDPAATYRIAVSVDGQDLGHADVDVVTKGKELKNVDTDEYIPLKDGRTLPIKFRIEEGAVDIGLRWASVGVGGFSGSFFTCGVTTTGAGYCWGSGEFGQGGSGVANRLNRFAQPISGARTLISVDPLSEAHCALAADGTAWCSGSNGFGVIGTTVALPLASEPCLGGRPCTHDPLMVETTLAFTELHTFSAVGCGLATDSRAYCWGTFQSPYLGGGNGAVFEPCIAGLPGCSRTPIPVAGGHDFVAITVGAASCGLTAPGDPLGNVWCWGFNSEGAFGNGTTTTTFEPVRAANGMTFTSIDAGSRSTCGLTAAGEAYCWGFNVYGRLGDGTTTRRLTPVAVAGGHAFASISISEETESHACGVTTTGDAYCWGLNDFGQLGDGTTNNSTVPVLVQGGHKFADISADGGFHTCGVTTQGEMYCWGSNSYGQLGSSPTPNLGDAVPHSVPELVLDPS